MSRMKKFVLSLSFVFAVVAVLVTPARGATTWFVGMGFNAGNKFFPSNITVFVGDTVTWTNATASQTNHSVSPTNNNEAFCGTNIVTNTCSVTFNTTGSFAYVCLPHMQLSKMTGLVVVASAPNVPPTVSITNPPNNTIFAAPGKFTINAAASDSDGSVTNVALMTNNVVVTNVRTAPFTVSLSNLDVGLYSLTARATDNAGASTTSSAISVRVVPTPLLSLVTASNTPIQFQFNTVTGVNYVVEGATVLTNFGGLVTNSGSGNAMQYSAPSNSPAQQFYRVRVQP